MVDMTASMKRQAWLDAAMRGMSQALFADQTIPANLRISCGFPKGRGGKKGKAIGQCWASEASGDGHFEIFISPELGNGSAPVDAYNLLNVIAHEMIHAIVGIKAGHKRPFSNLAKAIGLEGKMTATIPGEAFKARVRYILDSIGPYPMGALTEGETSGPKKQTGSRLIKCTCPECGYTVRTTLKWLNESGAPLCPVHREAMTIEGVAEGPSGEEE